MSSTSLDTAAVQSLPWVNELLDNIQQVVKKTIYSWAEIVSKLTDNEDDIVQWIRAFKEVYEDTSTAVVTDMAGLQSDIISKIEKSLEKMQELCISLQVDMPDFGHEKLCLLQEHSQLKNQISKYEEMIKARTTLIDKLKLQEKELCSSLGREVRKRNVALMQSEIDEFREYINQLETEKFNRLEKFTVIREDILSIMAELKYKPSTNFEINVCRDDNFIFLVTDENMELVEEFHQRLITDLKNVKEEILHLKTEIEKYWNLLETDMLEREHFRQNTVGYSLATLETLRLEKLKCEDLKKTNIKVFVDRLRNDLVNVWKKCHCVDDVKLNFGFYFTDCYTEDLLELHENELRKWQQYYEEHKELITLREKHEKLWSKMLQLEGNATRVDRYVNRGGQLLKEERERNKLAKLIPKIEDELIEMSNKLEARTGNPFTTFGQTIQEYIDNLYSERENAKKQKLSAHKLQRDKMTPGTPHPSTNTMNIASSSKRKLPFTPVAESQKKPKLGTKPYNSENQKNKVVPKITVSSSKTKRLSFERSKRLRKIRKSLSKQTKNNNEQYVSSEYCAFEDEVSTRQGCRSTLIVDLGGNLAAPGPSLATTTTPMKSYTLKASGRKTPVGAKLTAAKSNTKLLF